MILTHDILNWYHNHEKRLADLIRIHFNFKEILKTHDICSVEINSNLNKKKLKKILVVICKKKKKIYYNTLKIENRSIKQKKNFKILKSRIENRNSNGKKKIWKSKIENRNSKGKKFLILKIENRESKF